MSNEYKDWRRDEVLEHLPEGWQVVVDINGNETLRTEKGSVLTFEEAYEIQFAEYNRGYDSALRHIQGICNEELED